VAFPPAQQGHNMLCPCWAGGKATQNGTSILARKNKNNLIISKIGWKS
jgi:hypothetical protein